MARPMTDTMREKIARKTAENIMAAMRQARFPKEYAAEAHDEFEATVLKPMLLALIEPVMEENESQRDALKTVESWLERWASHVGNCAGGNQCTCGLTRVRYEARAALSPKSEKQE